MFGGGPKKEKVEDEDRGENSGSAKAQKEKEAEENPEVRHNRYRSDYIARKKGANILGHRMKPPNPRMFTSSLSSV